MKNLDGLHSSDSNIDKKAQILFDYFDYFLSENEYSVLKHQPLENHLSLLEKIDFRLNGTKIQNSSKTVIRQLIENELFDTKNDFFSQKEKVKVAIKDFRRLFTQPFDTQKLKETIEKIVHLFSDYFDYCMKQLESLINNEKEFEQQKDDILYYTKLVSAELIRLGYKYEELMGNNGLIRVFLNGLVSFDSNQMNEVIDFIKKDKKSIFILKIENVYGDTTNLNISYNQNIQIVSGQNIDQSEWNQTEKEWCQKFIENRNDISFMYEKIYEIDLSLETKSSIDRIFSPFLSSDSNCIFLTIFIEYKSEKNAIQKAFREAENVLSYLNYSNKPQGGIISEHFLIEHCDSNPKNITIKQYFPALNLKYIAKRPCIGTKSEYKLLDLDKLLFKAFTSTSFEDKIFNAWRYIEVLMKNHGRDEDKIEAVAHILLVNEEENKKSRLRILIFNFCLNNDEMACKNMTKERIREIIQKNEDRISELKTHTDYYFTNQLIKEYETLKIDYKQSYKLYKDKLNYLYEQRNYIAHQSQICYTSIESFISVTQILLEQVRITILNELVNRNVDLNECLKKLIQKGKDLKSS